MKLLTFRPPRARTDHFGVLLSNGSVLDVSALRAGRAMPATQIHRIPQQIAWYSHAGLRAGDIISTGSPAGTGAGYQGEGTWYLQHGDRLECEIERIGTLRNAVSSRKRRS